MERQVNRPLGQSDSSVGPILSVRCAILVRSTSLIRPLGRSDLSVEQIRSSVGSIRFVHWADGIVRWANQTRSLGQSDVYVAPIRSVLWANQIRPLSQSDPPVGPIRSVRWANQIIKNQIIPAPLSSILSRRCRGNKNTHTQRKTLRYITAVTPGSTSN